MRRSRTYRKIKASRAAIISLHVRHLRVRRLFWKAREIIRLRRDGIEKLEGGFILDRHYVETLVDRTVHLASRACHDAAMLNGRHDPAILDEYDRQRHLASLILADDPAASHAESRAIDEPPLDEPEYRMLARAIDWIGTPGQGRQPSLWGLVNRVAVLATANLGELPLPSVTDELELAGHGWNHHIRLIDTDIELQTKPRSGAGPDSAYRLLALLFESSVVPGMDADSASCAPARPAGQRRWQAITADRYLSVQTTDDLPAIRLDIILGNRPEDDLLFLLWPEEIEPGDSLPTATVVERAGRHALGWCLELSAVSSETCLRELAIWLATMNTACDTGEQSATKDG